MASIRDSIQANKRLQIFVVALLIVLIALMAKFYFAQRRENRALRIKILLMAENKRIPKPWLQLTTKAVAQPNTTTSTPTAKTINEGVGTSLRLTEEDTSNLAAKLDKQMKKIKSAELTVLDDNITIANELISREPDSYSAYKAKLIAMLVKEGKFSQSVDENEINSTLESMAQFNISSDKLARREAGLIASTNESIQSNEIQLEDLARDKEFMESQLASFDPNSPDSENLHMQIQEIENKQSELLSSISNLENNLYANTNQLINEDVVEIPFMRMLAQNDYQAVSESAQSFIEQFPNSPNGYFYLVRSLELQGQKDEAISIIQNAKLPQDSRDELIKRLESESSQDPKNYWQKLNF